MNQKQLVTLLVLVALVGGAGLFVHKARQSSFTGGGTAAGGKLLGSLPVNDIARVTIRQQTNEVSLVKKDDLWRVGERNDYPASFTQISEFLLKARDFKIVQVEKVGPSQLARLQLAPGPGTNSPMVIEFKGAGDKAIATLLVGKAHLKKSPRPSPMGDDEGWPDGRYVKVSGSDDVALINDALELQARPEDWLNKDFIKVEKARSVEVAFPVATNSWKLTRETESGEWTLAEAKPDEKLDSSKTVSVSNPLGNPSFNDVLPGNTLEGTGTNAPVVVKVATFEDFNYTISVGQKTNENYRVTVAVTATIPKERAAGADEKPEDKARLDKEFKDRQQKLEAKLKQEQSYANWTYLVQSWTVEPLLKERAQLMAEKKDETKKDDETSAATEEKADEPTVENPPLPAIEVKPAETKP